MSEPDFIPKRVVITAITNNNPAIVTAASHGYNTGDVIKINVPVNYGMDFGSRECVVTVVNANSFSIDIDTSLLDPFVVPTVTTFTLAEALPISAETDNIAT